MASKKLLRSNKNKLIAGVCGGIGEYLDIDPTIVRIVFVVLSLMGMGILGIIAYFILVLVIPQK